MAWFKVDDLATFQAKVMDAGNDGFGAWVRLGCHSNAHLLDGLIPDSVVRMIASRREVAKMVKAGLAHAVLGGIQLDELMHQPTKDEVIARRVELSAKRAEAGRAGGKASGIQRAAKQLASTAAKQIEAPTRPDPTRPDPDPVDLTPGTSALASPLVSLTSVRDLWMARLGCGPFVAGLERVQERVEHYARTKAGARSADQVCAEAIDAFVRIAESFSAGYRPQKNGDKFADHWARIEEVLDGAPIEERPQKPGAGPTIVANLDFAKKER
jgi:hypothetical protein